MNRPARFPTHSPPRARGPGGILRVGEDRELFSPACAGARAW